MTQGKRDSEWHVLCRCLALIRAVQHTPADWRAIVKVIEADIPEAYGEATGQQLYKRFRDDIDRIRDRLAIVIKADRRSGEYTIRELETPLLDLPEDNLKAMAWLEQVFTPATPNYQAVQSLLRTLKFYLSTERRRQIEQARVAFVLDLGQRDEDRIDPEVETKLSEALVRRRRVEFDYYSPANADGQARRHVVDIYEPPYFDTERGHHYVYGWCHYAVTPDGKETVEDYITYRLGRIRNLTLLPNKLGPAPPPPRRYSVQFWLSERIARGGVTQRRWTTIDRVEPHPGDGLGGVMVYGTTPHPFFAVQELMHYRHHCRVVGGSEMVNRMRNAVKKMAELYQPEA